MTTTPSTSNAANFNQWYNNTLGVNQEIAGTLTFVEIAPGEYQYSSNSFFPIDGLGFDDGSGTGDDGYRHNFHFTLELNTTFDYLPGRRTKIHI